MRDINGPGKTGRLIVFVIAIIVALIVIKIFLGMNNVPIEEIPVP